MLSEDPYPTPKATEEPSVTSSAYEQINSAEFSGAPVEGESTIIARPPQVISREAQVFSEPMSSDSVLPPSEQGEEILPSGSVDGISYSEKKKKKKDKV